MSAMKALDIEEEVQAEVVELLNQLETLLVGVAIMRVGRVASGLKACLLALLL